MVSLAPLIESFEAGEISPRFHVQSRIEAARKGVAQMENFISTSHGPAFRRGGFVFTESIAGSYGRIFQFSVSQANSFIVSASDDGNLRVNDTAGSVITEADLFTVNSDFLDGDTGWTVVDPGSANVIFGPSGVCLLNSSAANEAAIQQEITVTNPANEHAFTVISPSIGERIIMNIGTAQGGSDLGSFDVSGLRVITKTFTPGIATFWIEVRSPDEDPDPILDKVQIYEVGAATPVVFAHPWDQNDIINLQVGMPAGDFTLYMVSPRFPPQKLVYDLVTRAWTFEEVVFTDPPVEWVAGNYPSTITFFQGRMWLGGTPSQPEKFWGSKSALYEDFGVTEPTVADDSVTFSLSARGKIEWMVGAKNLLIGTENAEHIITSESGVVKAGDIQAERQSSYGSSNNQSEQIGNKVLYTSPDGRKVREMGFQWTDEGYISRDLTFVSEHITRNDRIVEAEWVQNPDNLLWCVSGNGNLITATYERGYEILGWHRHTTKGDVLSVAAIESFGVSQLWMLVDRGFGSLYLERYDDDDFIDSSVTINNDIPSDTITLAHLPNETVSVVADGAVHPDVVLDGSGVGTLQNDYTNVVAGIGYVSTLKTLPLDFGNPAGGSGRPSLMSWTEIYVYIIDSHLPKIQGDLPPDRSPSTPMNTAEPPITDFVKVMDLGWELGGAVTVIQDLPISCEVGGIFGSMSQEGLVYWMCIQYKKKCVYQWVLKRK